MVIARVIQTLQPTEVEKAEEGVEEEEFEAEAEAKAEAENETETEAGTEAETEWYGKRKSKLHFLILSNLAPLLVQHNTPLSLSISLSSIIFSRNISGLFCKMRENTAFVPPPLFARTRSFLICDDTYIHIHT